MIILRLYANIIENNKQNAEKERELLIKSLGFNLFITVFLPCVKGLINSMPNFNL